MTTRRALLLGGATALLAGCSQGSSWPGGDDNPPGAGGCRTPGQLVGFSRVAGAQLVYEQTRRPTSMKIDPAFLQQVNTWAEDWAALSGLGAIQAVVSFGAYVDKCQSYHQLGRAFDITELQHEAGTISMRYDQWQPGTAQQLRNYWRVAASLHLHFAYTLAYPFDSAHDDHVHVDNLVSKDGLSKFNSRSGTQLQLLAHACRHIFGVQVEASRTFDDPLKDAVRQVQRQLGLGIPLTEPAGWHEFLRAAARG